MRAPFIGLLLCLVPLASAKASAAKLRSCDPGGKKGTVFPNNPLGETSNKAKIFIYGFLLLYSFIGVSIVADQFMASIERITSKKRRNKVPGSAGRYVTSMVWNETVANLTLMALGSSAPEILLAINDIFKNQFHSGELGPSTIVGSAAFNLFVIIAVCINAIPAGETRQIKETGVFFITAFFSVFAYVWLLFIVQVHTPEIVDVTEGLVTFLFFPVLVWISWASDSGVLDGYGCRKKIFSVLGMQSSRMASGEYSEQNNAANAEQLAVANGLNLHLQGRRFAGGRNDADPTEKVEEKVVEEEDSVLVSCLKSFEWLCETIGALCRSCVSCVIGTFKRKTQQKKEDGTSEDDIEAEEIEAEINLEDPNISILDDDGEPIENEAGIITFNLETVEVTGDLEERQCTVLVLRKNGLDGRVACSYRMENLTATPGYDFVEETGVVDFKNGVDKANIEFTILRKEIGEKSDQFQIILEEPTNGAIFNSSSDGGEDSCFLTVTILNANPATTRMSRLFGFIDGRVNIDEMRQGSALWYEQVVEAYYCNGSPEDQQEAKFLDWVMHVLFFPWKMIYALGTPPSIYFGGWVCFVIALIHIGILTAIIGDMAELFGCAADIPDNITAITVVALGTSLPDLFASKTAATGDEFADASIVNVTGSNSVNVFLGIGLPWLMASLYWHLVDASEDELWMEKYASRYLGRCPTGCFVVESGELTFSVVVFSIGAVVCLVVIRFRRVVYDGELGGPAGSDSKACSSFLLFLLWFLYITLSVWKTISKTDDWVVLITALAICIPIVIVLMLFFGLMLQLLKIAKGYIGEEGFFAVAVAITILIVRMVYWLMFQ